MLAVLRRGKVPSARPAAGLGGGSGEEMQSEDAPDPWPYPCPFGQVGAERTPRNNLAFAECANPPYDVPACGGTCGDRGWQAARGLPLRL